MNRVKKLTVEIDHNCWKELKILALKNETSLQNIVRDILEKATGIRECSTKTAEK